MKNHLYKFAVLFLISIMNTNVFSNDFGPDPFELIEHQELDNGFKVYFAPSAKTNLTEIRVEVDVGWEAETKKNWGASHLLEHVLFRDVDLKDEMTYLQIIKEAGGDANGGTQKRLTSYYGSIPSAKSEWMLQLFAKMILEPEITEDYVSKEKGTVELEIGKPSAFASIFKANPKDLLNPSYLNMPSFWEKEFGLNFDEPFTLVEEQLSNRKLNSEKLQEHYDKYYYPGNMRIFIAGKYDKKKMMKIIMETWGKEAKVVGAKLSPRRKPTMTGRPYYKELLRTHTAQVAIGTKVVGLTLQEREVLNSYAKYLSHKLMKELRNLKGETYTAQPANFIYGDYGYTGVSFQSTDANLNKNIALAKQHVQKDAIQGGMKEASVTEAKKLYLSDYQLGGEEAHIAMDDAITYHDVYDVFGSYASPFQALKNTTTEQYNNILKKYYVPENSYEAVEKSAYLFSGDYNFLYGLCAIIAFSVMRRAITKKFKNDQIRWVRKLQYPPLGLLEVVSILAGWYIFVHAAYFLNKTFDVVPLINSNLLASTYIGGSLWIVMLVVVMQGVLCLLPKKLMVVEDKLVIKSISYYSHSIPLSEIKYVQTCDLVSMTLSGPGLFRKYGFRYYNFGLPWKEGLQISLKNGKSYFFSVQSAKLIVEEFEQFIPEDEYIDEKRAA